MIQARLPMLLTLALEPAGPETVPQNKVRYLISTGMRSDTR